MTSRLVVGFLAMALALGANAGPKNVNVLNFPPAQNVAGTVAVSNLPAVQAVNVGNLPAVQPVSGSVAVSNYPAVQDVNVVGGCSAGGWLAGFTVAQFNGAQGLLTFANACATEFPGTRICSTRDIARTTAVPSGLSGTAWLLPEFAGEMEAVSGSPLATAGAIVSHTCNGWNGGISFGSGQVVDSQGGLSRDDCTQARSVACCAP